MKRAADTVNSGESQYLLATIGAQIFAIEILRIRDILPRQDATPVPNAGRLVAGLINLRGYVVTLLDVREALALGDFDIARMKIICEKDHDYYGLLFESVSRIEVLNQNDMEDVPSTFDEPWHKFVKGIYRHNDGLLAVLNIDAIIEESSNT
jgi:purine-binding chemotaxis protein CheW